MNFMNIIQRSPTNIFNFKLIKIMPENMVVANAYKNKQ